VGTLKTLLGSNLAGKFPNPNDYLPEYGAPGASSQSKTVIHLENMPQEGSSKK